MPHPSNSTCAPKRKGDQTSRLRRSLGLVLLCGLTLSLLYRARASFLLLSHLSLLYVYVYSTFSRGEPTGVFTRGLFFTYAVRHSSPLWDLTGIKPRQQNTTWKIEAVSAKSELNNRLRVRSRRRKNIERQKKRGLLQSVVYRVTPCETGKRKWRYERRRYTNSKRGKGPVRGLQARLPRNAKREQKASEAATEMR